MATWINSGWPSFCGLVLFILLHCFSVFQLAEMINSYCPLLKKSQPSNFYRNSTCLLFQPAQIIYNLQAALAAVVHLIKNPLGHVTDPVHRCLDLSGVVSLL